MAMIIDPVLAQQWLRISRRLTVTVTAEQYSGQIRITDHGLVFYLAKHKDLFRLKSHLDWVSYTAKDLAQAINTKTVDQYYEHQHQSPLSPNNQWQDVVKELSLKSLYAHRVGRASLI